MHSDWTRLGTAAVAALAMALGAGEPALAQSDPSPSPGLAFGDSGQSSTSDDRQPAGASFGFPIPLRGFRIGASMKTLYDSNILRLGKGIPENGRTRGDFRFTPLVSVDGGLPVGRQNLFFGATLGKDYYARNDRLNRTRYSVDGGAHLHAGTSCNGSLTAGYRQRQSLIEESSVRTDNTQRVLDYDASIDCAPSRGLGFGGGISHTGTNNENLERRVQDSRETTYDAHFNLGAGNLGVFTAGGQIAKYDYPHRSLFVDNGAGGLDTINDKLDLYSGRVAYSHNIGTKLSISASGSYIKVIPKPKDVINLIEILPGITVPIEQPRKGYSGPGYNLAISYRPGTRLSASLNLGRSVTSSPNVAARLNVRDIYSAEVNYNLTQALTTSIGGSYTIRDYSGTFATTEEPLARNNDKSLQFYGRVSYAPRPLYAVDFELAHRSRKSDPPQYDYTSTSASLTLRVKFGRG